ncbi:MAG: tyrosine-type recombinase/integrase, partial [Firmicutes bacterium]|nr:tyrosine-type recombinase/integrase [Bacillota bacterium]
MSKAVWQSYFDEFLFELKAAGRAKRTMKDYRYHINRFFTTEGDCWPDGLRLAVRSHFADLIDSVSPATYNLRRQYLKAFFNWCVKEEILPKNPADSIPKQKDEPKIRNIDEKVIKALLNAPDQSTIAGLRDYALILLQLDTGIRPNEALSLLPEHLNLPAGQITIPMEIAKTRYSRTLAISDTTNKAIRRLLEARHPAWNEQSPVF